MANEDYREIADEAREHGLTQRHRFRLEMAVRRETAEEIAAALVALVEDPYAIHGDSDTFLKAAEIAREIGARQ